MTKSHPNPLDWIDAELQTLKAAGLLRRRPQRGGLQAAHCVLDGRELLHFGSNDYLGLAADPRLAEAVAQATTREGWGSGASPLLGGLGESASELERQLAAFEGVEAALLFTAGFAANAGAVAALVGPGDVVFGDAKNHASLMDGCRLSRADIRFYPHGDWKKLDALLTRTDEHRRKLIVTDSLFSMDGDLAPLGELVQVAQRHGAMLLVDEAHATGVFGAKGRGVAEYLGLEEAVDVRIGTLSKALGSVGGFAAGSQRLIEWLINRGRPYIFSTAAPSAIAAAGLAALRIVRQEPQRRQGLLTRAAMLRQELASQGWNLGRSASQIIPLIVGEPVRALALSRALADRGFFVPAIRPPTVPEGEACLRISLTALHTEEMLAALAEALRTLQAGSTGAGRIHA